MDHQTLIIMTYTPIRGNKLQWYGNKPCSSGLVMRLLGANGKRLGKKTQRGSGIVLKELTPSYSDAHLSPEKTPKADGKVFHLLHLPWGPPGGRGHPFSLFTSLLNCLTFRLHYISPLT